MSEFSRLFDTARLRSVSGKPVTGHERLDADARERAALAARFELPELGALTADLTIARRHDGTVRVTGTWHARYTQICVVTLEPFELERGEPLETVYLDAAALGDAREALVEADEVDMEVLTGRMIDLGELVAQNFGVQIDAHPRSPAATAAGSEDDGEGTAAGAPEEPANEPPAGPFAGLASLHRR
ncbi:MAG: DUF177 domain-containing protein [Rhodospirillaceae bacterium]|nr:DUF177 domain-containing protein [Rhodospirillaceae bacterium]